MITPPSDASHMENSNVQNDIKLERGKMKNHEKEIGGGRERYVKVARRMTWPVIGIP